jgi:hypothetical protein
MQKPRGSDGRLAVGGSVMNFPPSSSSSIRLSRFVFVASSFSPRGPGQSDQHQGSEMFFLQPGKAAQGDMAELHEKRSLLDNSLNSFAVRMLLVWA